MLPSDLGKEDAHHYQVAQPHHRDYLAKVTSFSRSPTVGFDSGSSALPDAVGFLRRAGHHAVDSSS